MSLASFIRGYVRISVTGLGTERFINICRNNGIKLYNLSSRSIKADMDMSVSDFMKIKSAKRITGVRIELIRRVGAPFFLQRNRKRHFFVYGILIFLLINIILSGYLWRIEVEGNSYYSAKEIIQYINSMNIHYGMRTGDVSCYDIETALRKEFDKITWVSADIDGSRLRINIKENEDDTVDTKDDTPMDIAASKDGIITSIVTRSGTPIVKAGDEVKAGDVLVMSKVESLNESGESFGVKYVHADADIIIETDYTYTDTAERAYEYKNYTGRVKEGTGIKIGNNLINYNIKECSFENYDVVTEYETISPYTNFNLPITYAYFYYKEYEILTAEYTDDELSDILSQNIDKYINNLQENGIQIVQNSVKINIGSTGATAEGIIRVRESAVTEQPPVMEPAKDAEEGRQE